MNRLRATKFAAVAALWVTAVVVVLPTMGEARNVKNTTRTNVNKNVNKNSNVNVSSNRNVNVNRSRNVDIDVDVDRHHHPIGTAVAVGAAVAMTAAVVGSVVRTLPPACSAVVVNGITYQQCGGSWYQPQYAGSSVQYVVINPPG